MKLFEKSVAQKLYSNQGNPAVLGLVPPGAAKVLDVGCGDGANAARLVARGAVVDGITLSAEESNIASKVCRRVWTHNLELGLPNSMSDTYDCCICSHVLEHICWPGVLLQDLRRVLSPQGGRLVVALPNLLFYKNRWALCRGKFCYAEGGLMDNTHFRWYTFQTAQQLLNEYGFHIEVAAGDGSFPLAPLRRWSPQLARAIDKIATRQWPGLFGWQFVLLCSVQT